MDQVTPTLSKQDPGQHRVGSGAPPGRRIRSFGRPEAVRGWRVISKLCLVIDASRRRFRRRSNEDCINAIGLPAARLRTSDGSHPGLPVDRVVLAAADGMQTPVVPLTERTKLVEHLRRIGCMVEAQWPVPDCWAEGADIVLLAIEHDLRVEIQQLLKSDSGRRPTLIAVVSYEDPSTLQLVLEAGAVAVIECPIRPFGLLTNLTIARSLWLERHDAEKRMRELAGIQRIEKAKVILMDGQGLNEAEAYESIRRQAMSKRLSMDDMAAAIIHANELLQCRVKGD
jgi:AmiR/NasT family two-component response regulator